MSFYIKYPQSEIIIPLSVCFLFAFSLYFVCFITIPSTAVKYVIHNCGIREPRLWISYSIGVEYVLHNRGLHIEPLFVQINISSWRNKLRWLADWCKRCSKQKSAENLFFSLYGVSSTFVKRVKNGKWGGTETVHLCTEKGVIYRYIMQYVWMA